LSCRLRVWKALTCLPNYEKDIKGRVLLDLLNEPDGVDLTWSGSDVRPPLTGYLLTVMDAIDKHSPNQAVYIVQVGVVGCQHAVIGDMRLAQTSCVAKQCWS
jgi:hypothetical protein